jgi:hypothetical protein
MILAVLAIGVVAVADVPAVSIDSAEAAAPCSPLIRCIPRCYPSGDLLFYCHG